LALLDLNPPATVGGRYGCFCSIAVLRFEMVSCLLLKSGSFASRTPKLTDLKIGHYSG